MSTEQHPSERDVPASASGLPEQVVVPASASLAGTLRTFGDLARFPDYYGANLDALLDCLRDAPPLQVTLTDAERLRLADPEGYRGLVDVLRQARSELPDFHFSISR